MPEKESGKNNSVKSDAEAKKSPDTRAELGAMRRILGTPPEDLSRTKNNLQDYLREYNKKYESNPQNQQEIQRDIKNAAEKTDPHDLQGGWVPQRMARMFLEQGASMDQNTQPLEFTVNLQNNDRFETLVGAAHLLPPTVRKIEVTDKRGNRRSGTRQIQGRVGYFDEKGYIPVFSGYRIRVLETITPEQAGPIAGQEKCVFEQMRGTSWPKNDDSPTETSIPGSELTRSPVNPAQQPLHSSQPSKDTPPQVKSSGPSKAPDSGKPAKAEVLSSSEAARERRGNLNIEGIGQVYVNMPSNLEAYRDVNGQPKQPQYIVYYHGNGGYENNKGMMDSHIRKLRTEGVPAILIYIRDDSGMQAGGGGSRWQNLKKDGTFVRTMDEVRGWTGVAVDKNISLTSFSGGYIGMGEALRQTTGTAYGKNITGINCLDSIYGYHEQIARFAADPAKKVNIVYTDHQNKNAAQLLAQIQKQRGSSGQNGELPGIRIEHSSGSHGGTVNRFEDFHDYLA